MGPIVTATRADIEPGPVPNSRERRWRRFNGHVGCKNRRAGQRGSNRNREFLHVNLLKGPEPLAHKALLVARSESRESREPLQPVGRHGNQMVNRLVVPRRPERRLGLVEAIGFSPAAIWCWITFLACAILARQSALGARC